MLKIENITFTYRRKASPVFRDFSLDLPSGGIYGILGRNGAGKSTLLYLISGLLTPKSGKVTYKGTDTRHRLPSTLGEIFIVPEEFSLPDIPFREYLKLNSRFYPRFSEEDLRRHLDVFDMPLDINLGKLSMGQKKKAFMSFALACNTSLLLMDEPTNGLDIPGKSRFRRFIVSTMTDERTIVISTHQVRDIYRILDHVIITDRSKVLLNEPVHEIVRRLKFMVTDNPALIESALIAQPSLTGTSIITVNHDDSETAINLESLFELTLDKSDLMEDIFAGKEVAV